MHHAITIIGTGNMGSSLIGGLIKSGYPANKIWACDPHVAHLNALQQQFSIHTTTDNALACQTADVILFAVKPHHFAAAAKTVASLISVRKPLVISIAAGISTAAIQAWLGTPTAIVRTMPNTPALIGCGATALYANTLTTTEQRATAESIMRAVGITVWLNQEDQLNAVTALSGSGPAYFFLCMEALQEAAKHCGLEAETVRLLTLQTAFGAARMALESDKPLAELRRQVTSPGGTTEKAISVLEENNIRHLFKQALLAAKQRSEELSHTYP